MATTSPDLIRRALLKVTKAAQLEIRAVASAAPKDPETWRASLFAAAPLIVSEYAPSASALALDWFEEIRGEASPRRVYTPTPRLTVTDEDVAATVARTTSKLYNPAREFEQIVEQLMAEAEANLEAALQDQVVAGFRDTMTGNSEDDPDAIGWRRFTRPGACKFCVMLAARGAVYTEATARFAAHSAETNGKASGGNCMCLAGPSYDPDAPLADVMQYVASRRKRSAEDRARLREYLNHNFPDAPG